MIDGGLCHLLFRSDPYFEALQYRALKSPERCWSSGNRVSGGQGEQKWGQAKQLSWMTTYAGSAEMMDVKCIFHRSLHG